MFALNLEKITDHLGARVFIDASQLLAPDAPAAVLDALNQYGVLVFPQIHVPDETLVAFTNQLGDMEAATRTADGSNVSAKGIYRIALDKDDKTQRDYVVGNNYWHMDGTSYEVPGKATLLKCESPASAGGETDFAHVYAAYEALPEDKKHALQNLRVIHGLKAVGVKIYDNPTPEDFERWRVAFPETEQPLVWHQANGRTSLVIGSTAQSIVDMPEAEGYQLLQELTDWCTQPQFTYRHHWQQGDLVIFNNPGLLHRSRPYAENSGRVMHRTTVKGVEAFTYGNI
ncbi:TauD/TfdA dioxygenase family protein [Halioxenophilus aromaticivorans]|uniref:TauD/TfdA family dioxygenase n=1 Tax=Halioxenophilus aromaticivorans TaxID=1306992 RepID=A0AAV3U5H2_9ALTE